MNHNNNALFLLKPIFNTVPLPPTDFSIVEEYHDNMETTVLLGWNPPQGSGPEFIVQNYSVEISPAPPYHPGVVILSSPPWNVTLLQNIEYTINITAMNCAGKSITIFLPVELGKIQEDIVVPEVFFSTEP